MNMMLWLIGIAFFLFLFKLIFKTLKIVFILIVIFFILLIFWLWRQGVIL